MMGADFRARMADRRSHPRGRYSWIASDHVLVEETDETDLYELSILPADSADCAPPIARIEGATPVWKRTLASIRVLGEWRGVTYFPDAIRRGDEHFFELSVPWGARGATVRTEVSWELTLPRGVPAGRRNDGVVISRLGRWYVAVAGDVEARWGDSLRMRGGAAIGVGASETAAYDEVIRLIAPGIASTNAASADHWNAYFASCPLIAADRLLQRVVDPETWMVRQLWHWWAARANVVRSLVDDALIFVAPDRARWLGSWSSDAPLTIAALSRSNARPLAIEVFLRYLRTSIDGDGHLTWYTHPDGRPCLGRLGDTGVLSHGLPELIGAAEIISRTTPGIITEDGVNGRSVLETLRWYLASSSSRDINGDGLWETSNLWEGAWDNKVAPMFRDVPIDEWISAMRSSDPREVGRFVAAHRRPSTTMVEQSAYLRALRALRALADLGEDPSMAAWAQERAAHVIDVVTSRHWHEETGTYRDWDVVGGLLTDADCLDGFYFLEFEPDLDRQKRLVDALMDTRRFGLPRPPTLARDDPRFRPDQYWDGSYWPREVAYVAPGLRHAGRRDLAEDILVEAVLCGQGKEVLEHLDSDTGGVITYHAGDATVYSQAMSIGLCLALDDLVGNWS